MTLLLWVGVVDVVIATRLRAMHPPTSGVMPFADAFEEDTRNDETITVDVDYDDAELVTPTVVSDKGLNWELEPLQSLRDSTIDSMELDELEMGGPTNVDIYDIESSHFRDSFHFHSIAFSFFSAQIYNFMLFLQSILPREQLQMCYDYLGEVMSMLHGLDEQILRSRWESILARRDMTNIIRRIISRLRTITNEVARQGIQVLRASRSVHEWTHIYASNEII